MRTIQINLIAVGSQLPVINISILKTVNISSYGTTCGCKKKSNDILNYLFKITKLKFSKIYKLHVCEVHKHNHPFTLKIHTFHYFSFILYYYYLLLLSNKER